MIETFRRYETAVERGIASKLDFAYVDPQSLRISQLLEDGRLEVRDPSHCALFDEEAITMREAFAGISMQRPRLTYLSSSTARAMHGTNRRRSRQ